MRFIRLLVLVLLIAGCSQTATGPPEIEYDRDVCDQCGMIISEPRFAATYRTVEGEEQRFDEVGGMLVMANILGHFESAQFWANDYTSGAPIPVADAIFVSGGEITSPMDFRIVAFATVEAAHAFSASHGGIEHTWEDLTELARDGRIEIVAADSGHSNHNG